jgi:ribosomal protein S18 acetylase RimI-like enzyme
MIIRKANKSDLGNIMLMYNSCVNGMLKNGIDQWDSSYPNVDVILADLKARTYFVAEENGEIIGGINIDQNQDDTYLALDWEDKRNQFLVVHRLAVKVEFWNDGIGKSLMLFTENLVTEKGLNSIRLDTYSGNPKAMEFYRRLGYTELGTIDLKPDKDKYHCFEKIIK